MSNNDLQSAQGDVRADIDLGAGEAGATNLELIEIAGRIKWFDTSKGYGFIVPDNGMADVLLHVTTLRRDGFQTAHEGTRILCEAVVRAKGLQVFRVISMDEFERRSSRPIAAGAYPRPGGADQRL